MGEASLRVVYAHVGPDPVVPAEVEALVQDRGAGACVTFIGTVRDNDQGREVLALEYEAHPDATAMLAALAGEFCEGHPELIAVAVAHRTGMLQIGDVAFVASVSSAHRQEGFEACAALVDAVKAGLPVWKHEVFTDGTEWVNAQ